MLICRELINLTGIEVTSATITPPFIYTIPPRHEVSLPLVEEEGVYYIMRPREAVDLSRRSDILVAANLTQPRDSETWLYAAICMPYDYPDSFIQAGDHILRCFRGEWYTEHCPDCGLDIQVILSRDGQVELFPPEQPVDCMHPCLHAAANARWRKRNGIVLKIDKLVNLTQVPLYLSCVQGMGVVVYEPDETARLSEEPQEGIYYIMRPETQNSTRPDILIAANPLHRDTLKAFYGVYLPEGCPDGFIQVGDIVHYTSRKEGV